MIDASFHRCSPAQITPDPFDLIDNNIVGPFKMWDEFPDIRSAHSLSRCPSNITSLNRLSLTFSIYDTNIKSVCPHLCYQYNLRLEVIRKPKENLVQTTIKFYFESNIFFYITLRDENVRFTNFESLLSRMLDISVCSRTFEVEYC